MEHWNIGLRSNDSERLKSVDILQTVIATPNLIRGKQSHRIASSFPLLAMTTFQWRSLWFTHYSNIPSFHLKIWIFSAEKF